MTAVTAFDSDVLIYAVIRGHPLGARVTELFRGDGIAGVGSVLLLAEVLAKPMRVDPASAETAALVGVLARLDLRPLDVPTGRLALSLASLYGLRAADAAHLATAVAVGAERFLTNNRKEFPKSIAEIDVLYPDDLPIA